MSRKAVWNFSPHISSIELLNQHRIVQPVQILHVVYFPLAVIVDNPLVNPEFAGLSVFIQVIFSLF